MSETAVAATSALSLFLPHILLRSGHFDGQLGIKKMCLGEVAAAAAPACLSVCLSLTHVRRSQEHPSFFPFIPPFSRGSLFSASWEKFLGRPASLLSCLTVNLNTDPDPLPKSFRHDWQLHMEASKTSGQYPVTVFSFFITLPLLTELGQLFEEQEVDRGSER